ncbi:replication protein [Vibrio parahaemolyticus]|nr:replication protein [Vibrio parahaemolyticus]
MLGATLNELLSQSENDDLDFTINGLVRGKVGMLIAAPNIGKSHLVLCLAIERAANIPLVGLSKSDTPKRTLIISSEDDGSVIRGRMRTKLKTFSGNSDVLSLLGNNILFETSGTPLVVPVDSSASDKAENQLYLAELESYIRTNDIDLVIVDTVTESIGVCDEVRDDRHIKDVIQGLASRSNASFLLVHHINKSEIRGEQEITMASGAGLTSIMRLTKCLLTLKLNRNKELELSYLKHNYLSNDEAANIRLEVKDNLTVNPDAFSLTLEVLKNIPEKQAQKPKPRASKPQRIIEVRGHKPERDKSKNLRDVL